MGYKLILLIGFIFISACTNTITNTISNCDSTWRGACIAGDRIDEALPILDKSWLTVEQRWHLTELANWTVILQSDLVPCAAAINGNLQGCHGTTTIPSRIISLSWVDGPAKLQSSASWEMCNAARWIVTGQLIDKGCA